MKFEVIPQLKWIMSFRTENCQVLTKKPSERSHLCGKFQKTACSFNWKNSLRCQSLNFPEKLIFLECLRWVSPFQNIKVSSEVVLAFPAPFRSWKFFLIAMEKLFFRKLAQNSIFGQLNVNKNSWEGQNALIRPPIWISRGFPLPQDLLSQDLKL